MSKKDENSAIINALKLKLGYRDLSFFVSLNGEAPNSCTILDKATSLVWKVARNRPATNPRLELKALEALPDGIDFIAKHVDSGELDVRGIKYFYLVFPYIEGFPLGTAIRSHIEKKISFSFEEIRRVGDTITKAICLLNDHDLVHQDIKPDNIIMKPNGEIVLIDLGIALFIEDLAKPLKKLEGPYAYMSPDKLAVIGNGKFRQWSKLNFTSDLFSLGLVLVELATLKRVNGNLEPNLADLYKVGELVTNLDIDEDTKNYLIPFLEQAQYEREMGVLAITGCEMAIGTQTRDHILWLSSSSKSINLIESFIATHPFKSKFGLIYSAEQVTSKKNILEMIRRGAAVKDKGGSFALDPCTYLQVHDEKHHRGTKYFEYGGLVDIKHFTNPPKFAPIGYISNFVKEVIGAQVSAGVTSFISPYLYVDSIEDETIESNFLLWQATKEYFDELGTSNPAYFGILISERMILSRSELMELAMMINNQRYAKRIYLRVESKRSQSQPITNKNFLENLRDFISSISKTKSILLAGSGVEGIGYLNYGISEVGTNPFFSQRKFSISDKFSDRGGGSEPAPRYFAQKLLNEVLVPQEIDTAISANPDLATIFYCDCIYCPNRDKESLAKHFLVKFDNMFSEVATKIMSNTSESEFCEWLTIAETSYVELEEGGVQFSTYTGGDFIHVWKQVF